jgi:hypothetical protein
MVYKRSFYSIVFMEKSVVYDEDLHVSLLEIDSRNNDAPIKYKQNVTSREKKTFFTIPVRSRVRVRVRGPGVSAGLRVKLK